MTRIDAACATLMISLHWYFQNRSSIHRIHTSVQPYHATVHLHMYIVHIIIVNLYRRLQQVLFMQLLAILLKQTLVYIVNQQVGCEVILNDDETPLCLYMVNIFQISISAMSMQVYSCYSTSQFECQTAVQQSPLLLHHPCGFAGL